VVVVVLVNCGKRGRGRRGAVAGVAAAGGMVVAVVVVVAVDVAVVGVVLVGHGIHCSPPHPTHFEASTGTLMWWMTRRAPVHYALDDVASTDTRCAWPCLLIRQKHMHRSPR